MIAGRTQLQAIAGSNYQHDVATFKTPVGFGPVTTLFADMKRHFSGTWFVGIHCQRDLNSRAVKWKHQLSRFSQQVIEDAMAEVVMRGDVSAPSLDHIRYLCQKITDENNSSNREAAKQARDRAMRQVKQMGVIRG